MTQKKRIYPVHGFAKVLNHIWDAGVQNIDVMLKLTEYIEEHYTTLNKKNVVWHLFCCEKECKHYRGKSYILTISFEKQKKLSWQDKVWNT